MSLDITTDSVRILFAAHSGSQGGAELCLDTTLRHLDRSKYDAVAYFCWDGPMADSARKLDVPVKILPLGWWMCYAPSPWHFKNLLLGSIPRIWRLFRAIKRERIDLVYTNTAVIFEAAIAARLARVPHVWHVHEVMTTSHMKPRILPLGLITRLVGWLSGRVIFESVASRQLCRKLIPPAKSLTVYNSVRFSEGQTAADPADTRARFGLEMEHCLIVWIGRFSRRKNPLMLIRAVARMKEAAGARFLFVGEGPLEQEIIDAVNGSGLRDTCRLAPFQDDVRPLLEAADLLVLTSQEESFGLVLVEAGACGIPVVATRSQGPAEIVADGQTGLLVDPQDEEELAAGIDRLVADPPARRRMGTAARVRVAERFSAEKNTREIENVFDELIGCTSGQTAG